MFRYEKPVYVITISEGITVLGYLYICNVEYITLLNIKNAVYHVIKCVMCVYTYMMTTCDN